MNRVFTRWSRRQFLTTAAITPTAGLLATGCQSAPTEENAIPVDDIYSRLGVRPFINAAGTYTALTASLMPQEVVNPRGLHLWLLEVRLTLHNHQLARSMQPFDDYA